MFKRPSSFCEIKIDGEWVRAPADEAHRTHRDKPKRCPSCHGTVITTGNYTTELRVSVQHRKQHDGCPLLARCFKGTTYPHPEALV